MGKEKSEGEKEKTPCFETRVMVVLTIVKRCNGIRDGGFGEAKG